MIAKPFYREIISRLMLNIFDYFYYDIFYLEFSVNQVDKEGLREVIEYDLHKLFTDKITFLEILNIKDILNLDLNSYLNGDPECSSIEEVIICYPGFRATFYYRIAHLIYEKGFKLISRFISDLSRTITNIDIHPGAVIGNSFCIDHGAGVVIGATSLIGDNVRIYHGVTLGSKYLVDVSAVKNIKRHPTIGNNVIIFSNSSILGGDTVIKDNSIINANSFITRSN